MDATFFVPLMTTACYGAIVFLVFFFYMKRGRNRRIVDFVLICIVLFTILVIVLLVVQEKYMNYDLNVLKKEGRIIVKQLEVYYDSHNNYPGSLSRITNKLSRFGRWRYVPKPKDNSYILSIGNYENGFILYWDKDANEWQLNN
ncbi:MAG: hypothetical protein EOM12_15380 [Verrucomicrobiae bacterium]|nr:hypothetical protein [Verrucomicrobiae bacterium]